MHRAPVDLADVVGHVVAETAAEAAAAGVAVEADAHTAPTVGDALLLERAVHNLVENGIRHNVRDGTGWVRVATRAEEGGVTVEVSNSGAAVPPYDVPALFEPFRRLGPDRTVSARGAGLGLSITRSVAHAHGGSVAAVPRDGGGLRVTMRLRIDTHAGDDPADIDEREQDAAASAAPA